VEILRGPEVQGQDGARRIVDGPEEQDVDPHAEPVELTAVDEDEAAHGRVARAPGAVLRRPAPALGRHPPRPPQPPDGAATDGQALERPELFGRVAVIEFAVGGLGQLDDPVTEFDVQGSTRRLASAAVDQAPHPLGPIPGLEATELSQAHLQAPGSLGGRDLSGHGQLHHARPAGLLATHRDDLPWLHGRTLSLNS
jgi:hypothetical protein